MKEITFEMAATLGIVRDDALDYAYRSVEGCSILSPGTERAMESAYKRRDAENRATQKFATFEGETLRVI